MEDTYGIQSRIGSIIVVERWYCCRGSPVFSDRNIQYAHLPYGPVPDHFEMLLGKMAEDHIAHINILYDGAYEKHQVIPEQDIPEGGLTDLELNVLERVYEKFKDFGSSDISAYSHKEKGYQSY